MTIHHEQESIMANKIGLYYSVFSNSENMQLSITYICHICSTIKTFWLNQLNTKNIYINICTDNFTYNIIRQICYQENIKLDNEFVKFKIFNKNPDGYLRGAIWRFSGLLDTIYDIVIICEGDFQLQMNLRFVHYMLNNTNIVWSGHINRKINTIVDRYILASGIMIRPNRILDDDKILINELLELFDHIDTLSYGCDERLFKRLAENILYKYQSLFLLFSSKITDGLNAADFEYTSNQLSTMYVNPIIETSAQQTNCFSDITNYSYINFDFILKTNKKLCYILNNNFY